MTMTLSAPVAVSMPTRAELSAALASFSPRVQVAAMAIRPPEYVNPQDVKIVRDALRQEAEARALLDITV
jgi:hypothetical protein